MVIGGGGVDGGVETAEFAVEGAGFGGTKEASMASFIEAMNSLALSLLQNFACLHSSILRWMAGSTKRRSSSESKRKLFKIRIG